MTTQHRAAQIGDRHAPHNFEFDTHADRLSADVSADNMRQLALVLSDKTTWRVVSVGAGAGSWEPFLANPTPHTHAQTEVSGLAEAMAQIAAGSTVPDTVRSFDAVVANYRTFKDFTFGTRQASPRGQQISDIASLSKEFDYWAYNLGTPTQTINVEPQRYVDFTNAPNFVFAPDALELTATLPGGVGQGFTQTTLSAAATSASRDITVADASNIRLGQVVSLGANQYASQRMTASYGVRGTITVGCVATLTYTPHVDLGIGTTPIVFQAIADGASTRQSMAQALVDAFNANTQLAAMGLYAYRDPINPGTYYVVTPKLAVGVKQFGAASTGSFVYLDRAAQATGTGFLHERKSEYFFTYVVAKNGNTLTLNHPLVAASGAPLYVNVARLLQRVGDSGTSSATIPFADVTGIEVGQACSFGNNDSTLRRVQSVDTVAKTVTFNTTVSVVEGNPGILLPVYLVPTVSASATTAQTVLTSTLSPSVRVGMQVSVYNTNVASNAKILNMTVSGSNTIITTDNPVGSTGVGSLLEFHDAIASSQIWSKWGVLPGVDAPWIAMELECDLPNSAALGAWPAFWIFADPTNPNPGGVTGLSEIDMLEIFNYFGNATANSYRPSATSPLLYGYGGLTASPLPGNNSGGTRRKIGLIYSNNLAYFYLDGVLIFVKSFVIRTDLRAQVAVNLAMGSLGNSLNSNGFFPIDLSQYPSKLRMRRLRVLGGF